MVLRLLSAAVVLLSAGAAAVDCGASVLVKTYTGANTTCSWQDASPYHLWPVQWAESDCHGWQETDGTGKTHDNSANTVKCNDDGTFEWTQYAGNLTCQGSPVRKVFTLNDCTVDVPDTLRTMLADNNCCTNPDGDACKAFGFTSVSGLGQQAKIFKNGAECTSYTGSLAPAAAPAPEPAAEPAPEPAAEPAAEPVAEPAAETAAEKAAEPAAETAAETATEPATEPAAEGSAASSPALPGAVAALAALLVVLA